MFLALLLKVSPTLLKIEKDDRTILCSSLHYIFILLQNFTESKSSICGFSIVICRQQLFVHQINALLIRNEEEETENAQQSFLH